MFAVPAANASIRSMIMPVQTGRHTVFLIRYKIQLSFVIESQEGPLPWLDEVR